MSRTKKVSFTDSLAIWAETASEQEIRDGVVMLSIYARQRKFDWRLRIELTDSAKKTAQEISGPLFKEGK